VVRSSRSNNNDEAIDGSAGGSVWGNAANVGGATASGCVGACARTFHLETSSSQSAATLMATLVAHIVATRACSGDAPRRRAGRNGAREGADDSRMVMERGVDVDAIVALARLSRRRGKVCRPREGRDVRSKK
jgi:hypothetical protein